MKKYLAKLAVVAVALVGVLSAQSEAAVGVAHVQHGGVQVHRVIKGKQHCHKKVKARKVAKCKCQHKVNRHRVHRCAVHVCDVHRHRRMHRR